MNNIKNNHILPIAIVLGISSSVDAAIDNHQDKVNSIVEESYKIQGNIGVSAGENPSSFAELSIINPEKNLGFLIGGYVGAVRKNIHANIGGVLENGTTVTGGFFHTQGEQKIPFHSTHNANNEQFKQEETGVEWTITGPNEKDGDISYSLYASGGCSWMPDSYGVDDTRFQSKSIGGRTCHIGVGHNYQSLQSSGFIGGGLEHRELNSVADTTIVESWTHHRNGKTSYEPYVTDYNTWKGKTKILSPYIEAGFTQSNGDITLGMKGKVSKNGWSGQVDIKEPIYQSMLSLSASHNGHDTKYILGATIPFGGKKNHEKNSSNFLSHEKLQNSELSSTHFSINESAYVLGTEFLPDLYSKYRKHTKEYAGPSIVKKGDNAVFSLELEYGAPGAGNGAMDITVSSKDNWRLPSYRIDRSDIIKTGNTYSVDLTDIIAQLPSGKHRLEFNYATWDSFSGDISNDEEVFVVID